MLIRKKAEADGRACLELMLRVNAIDHYPVWLPPDPASFLSPPHQKAAWVAQLNGRIAGHVALHDPAGPDPTLDLAARATGLPADRLILLSRLFVAPELRRAGVGRTLLRHAAAEARAIGRRAVLDVGESLARAVALYEAEGWDRAGSVPLRLETGESLPLWVFVSPEHTGPEPKIELHVHLEGSVRPRTLAEIAHRNGHSLPDIDNFAFSNLGEFIRAWNLTTACLQTPDDLRQIVVDYAGEAKRHGAVYLEGIFTPEPALAQRIGIDAIFAGYAEGAAVAQERHDVIVRLTPEQMRGCDPAFGEALAHAAVRYRDRGVVGFGLSGMEGAFPDAPHERAMRIAAEGGLGLVPHAGEAAGPESIRSSLRLGASRIRHGVRAVEDPDLVAELAERGIVLDVCPTSNLRLGVSTAGDPPLRRLAEAGVRCSISTDDPALFGTDLSTEYGLAKSVGVPPAAVYQSALQGALCDDATRAELARRFG